MMVNDAGIQQVCKDITALADRQWEEASTINLPGMFYLTKAALPYRGEDDSIIDTASVNVYIGPGFLVDYST